MDTYEDSNIYIVISAFHFEYRLFYQTELADIPLISEKNDLRIDGGVSLSGFNSTISMGLTKNIAVQGYGNFLEDSRYLQASAGYFKKLNENKVIESYVGFGHGYRDFFSSTNGGSLDGTYQLYFGQLNYGQISSALSNLEYAFSLKTGIVHSQLTEQGYFYQAEPNPNPTPKEFVDRSFLIEPSALIRFGKTNLKFNLKLGLLGIYKFTNRDESIPYGPFNMGFGLNYYFRN